MIKTHDNTNPTNINAQENSEKPTQRLTYDDRVRLVRAVLQRSGVIPDVVNRLRPEHFPATDEFLQLVWHEVLAFVRKLHYLPNEAELAGSVCNPHRFVDASEMTLSTYRSGVRDLYEPFEVEPTFDEIIGLLQRMLAEVVCQEFLAELPQVDAISRARTFLGDLEEIKSIGQTDCALVTDQWHLGQDRVPARSTGVPYLDEFLDGGHVDEEAYLYLGPTGCGKSAFFLNMAIAMAKQSQADWLLSGKQEPLRLTYLVSYDMPRHENLLRVLSHVAQIPFDTLLLGSPLSTREHLKPYEREMFEAAWNAGKPVQGEQERLKDAWKLLASLPLRYIDLSSPIRGIRPQDELLGKILGSLEKARNSGLDVCCGAVLIDGVKDAVHRLLGGEIDSHKKRELTGSFPGWLRRDVLRVLKCPGHFLHSYSAEMNAAPAGTIGTHMDAAENKAIGENCHFCFNFSKLDQGGRLILSVSKARRAARTPAKVLEFHGSFMTFKHTGGLFGIDPAQREVFALDAVPLPLLTHSTQNAEIDYGEHAHSEVIGNEDLEGLHVLNHSFVTDLDLEVAESAPPLTQLQIQIAWE